MRRTKREYGLEVDPFACYKMEAVHDEARENFESTDKWLYLGADARNSGFAKVGITMGNLTTRSSSSESPVYHLFCAFKCRQKISKIQLKAIETSALNHLEKLFTYDDGSTKRELHHESGKNSECFYDVDFMEFLETLHHYLYENHREDFVLSGLENDDGVFIDCEFNSRMSRDEINAHIRRILQ